MKVLRLSSTSKEQECTAFVMIYSANSAESVGKATGKQSFEWGAHYGSEEQVTGEVFAQFSILGLKAVVQVECTKEAMETEVASWADKEVKKLKQLIQLQEAANYCTTTDMQDNSYASLHACPDKEVE